MYSNIKYVATKPIRMFNIYVRVQYIYIYIYRMCMCINKKDININITRKILQ